MKFKNRLYWLAAIASVILDILSKNWVIHNIAKKSEILLWPGVFHLTYVTNDGAAWSLFKGAAWLPWLSLAASLGLIAWALFGPWFEPLEQLGYGFILGGAIGNGIDRFTSGSVVDFLHFILINFPVFNLADVSINVGLLCLIIAYFKKEIKT